MFEQSSVFHSFRGKFASVFAAVYAIYHFVTAFVGLPGLWLHRGIHICGILFIIFLVTGWKEKEKGYIKGITPVLNCLALAILIYSSYHIMLNPTATQLRQGNPSPADIFVCYALVVLIIEAARRLLGWVLSVIAILMLSYILFGQYLTGPLAHPGFTTRVIVTTLFNTMRGLFGSPIGVTSTYIIMFVIFSAFLDMSGGGNFFSELAIAISKGKIGGPAKVAVLASGFMGMINGSPVANVAGTGVFTIPLMKKNGYPAAFAGGVEAAASTGGMILPPIMGASVFLMAEITMTPYLEICIRTAFSAILYYVVIYLSVHIEAIRRGLKPIEMGDKKPVSQILKEGSHYMIALAILTVTLIVGYSPTRCALYAILSLIVLSWFRPETRMGVRKIFICFEEGAKSCMVVSAACCVAGIVVATVTITGLGIKLATFVTILAGNSLMAALLLTAGSSIVLGMGVNAVASYIIIAVVLAPIVTKIGLLNMFTAHLFCYFFSMTAGMTPPVATVSYTAAGIAEADQVKTCLNALTLAYTAFVIPFAFVYNPGILLYGTPWEIFKAMGSISAGALLVTCGFRNWMFTKLNLLEILIALTAGTLLMIPEGITDIVGLVIGVCFFMYKYKSSRKAVTV